MAARARRWARPVREAMAPITSAASRNQVGDDRKPERTAPGPATPRARKRTRPTHPAAAWLTASVIQRTIMKAAMAMACRAAGESCVGANHREARTAVASTRPAARQGRPWVVSVRVAGAGAGAAALAGAGGGPAPAAAARGGG